jgi:hypothetical protein
VLKERTNKSDNESTVDTWSMIMAKRCENALFERIEQELFGIKECRVIFRSLCPMSHLHTIIVFSTISD